MKCRYFCRLPLDISPVYLTRGISGEVFHDGRRLLLKDGFAGCTPAVRRCRGRQRFPVGADSISARGGSRRRALSSGRGPGMPGPYRVAIVSGGMTFLRTSAIAGKFTACHCRGRRPRRPAAG